MSEKPYQHLISKKGKPKVFVNNDKCLPTNCKTFIIEKEITIMKCADCNCSTDACQSSVSSFQCPNCTFAKNAVVGCLCNPSRINNKVHTFLLNAYILRDIFQRNFCLSNTTKKSERNIKQEFTAAMPHSSVMFLVTLD